MPCQNYHITELNKVFESPEAKKLLNKYWREKNNRSRYPATGFCYIATEALFYLIGGLKSGFKPKYLRYKNQHITHWWLENEEGMILDPTLAQYGGKNPNYKRGKGCGFLNGYEKPSRRAKKLIELMKETN